jgi:hypothetical protein
MGAVLAAAFRSLGRAEAREVDGHHSGPRALADAHANASAHTPDADRVRDDQGLGGCLLDQPRDDNAERRFGFARITLFGPAPTGHLVGADTEPGSYTGWKLPHPPARAAVSRRPPDSRFSINS